MEIVSAVLTAGASWFDDGRFGQAPPSEESLMFDCSHQFPENDWTDCTVSQYCLDCYGDGIKCFSKCIYKKARVTHLEYFITLI